MSKRIELTDEELEQVRGGTETTDIDTNIKPEVNDYVES